MGIKEETNSEGREKKKEKKEEERIYRKSKEDQLCSLWKKY
jgi:hypothetical protein